MIFQWNPSLFLPDEKRKLQSANEENQLIHSFISKVWNQYNNSQKIKALQNLENIYAKRQNRKSVKVKEYNSEMCYGEYDGNRNTMFINLNHSSYEILDTYLHEARHAYQEKSVKNKEGYDVHSLNMIEIENAVDENGDTYNYIEDGVGYDTACCEMDANNDAMRTMLSYSEEFGNDPEYLNYLEERKEHYQTVNRILNEERKQRQEIQKEQAEKAYYRNGMSEEYKEVVEHIAEDKVDRMEKDSPYIEKSLDYTKEHCEEMVCEELRERTTESKEKFESEIYKNKPDEQRLSTLKKDNNQNLEYIKQQQQRYDDKEKRKFGEIQKYVNENNLTPQKCENDEKYQGMLSKYLKTKEENNSLKYQKEVLEEQNKQIDEIVPHEEKKSEEQREIDETVREKESETAEEQRGIDEIAGGEENETTEEQRGMDEIVGGEENETSEEQRGMDEIVGEEEREIEEIETASSAVDDSENEDEEYTYSY